MGCSVIIYVVFGKLRGCLSSTSFSLQVEPHDFLGLSFWVLS